MLNCIFSDWKFYLREGCVMTPRIYQYISLCLWLLCLMTPFKSSATRGQLSEFDREVFVEIAKRAEVQLKYEVYSSNMSWQQLLDGIKNGDYQVTGSAIDTKLQHAWAKFSVPYRVEEAVLYVPIERELNIKTVDDFISFMQNNPEIKIGVIDGWVQPNPQLDAFISDPKNSKQFVKESSDAKVVNLLVYGDVDAVILERVSRHDNPIAYYPEFRKVRMNATAPISFIMTRNGPNAVSDSDLEKINKVINEMQNNGELKGLFDNYINS